MTEVTMRLFFEASAEVTKAPVTQQSTTTDEGDTK